MYSLNSALGPFAPYIDHYFIQCTPVLGDAVLIEGVVFVYDTLDTASYHLLATSVCVELTLQMESDLREHAFMLNEECSYWEYECRLVVVPYVN
jgi:hypothetical protein